MKIPVENIVELTVEHQFTQAYHILSQIRPDLTVKEYLELLNDKSREGKRLFALYHDTSIVALAGISWREDSYNERYVYVQYLVTDVNHRPSGLGYTLLSHINNWAKEHGAEYITLES
ncbi:GNAT family N-acetyltransferase [Bacillus sp. SD075]|uniref:GNAT family N-acetyltransferase n=1 Tax=Bacillus sp. SD075 TaxID=2781732 RepID=UPI001A95C541|nr:GNAT family N-acetyltransferase [Bacillus sp. SD075]MBO0998660.1 GNAT family N-acetyltransferase [Bacillus sp. SD075]